MRDNATAVARIDVAVAEIRITLPTLATEVEIAELSAKIDNQMDTMHRYLATKEDVGDLRGYL